MFQRILALIVGIDHLVFFFQSDGGAGFFLKKNMSAVYIIDVDSHVVRQGVVATKNKMDSSNIDLNTFNTGDVVLFNRRCYKMSIFGALICSTAKIATHSTWGMRGFSSQ